MANASHVYTHGHHESVLRAHRWRDATNSAAYLVPHLAPGMSLLDVGCGPGTLTADLARLVAPGRVTAVDLTSDVLDLARDWAERVGRDTIDFHLADVHSLDFPDASFDVVHAHQLLQHVADPVGALREMARVCRPGGVVAVRDGDFGAFSWYPRQPELDEWLALYREQARVNGGQPDAGRRLLSWARAAGLTDVTATVGVWCFASPDDRRWWAESWADRVRHSDLAGQLLARGAASADDLDRIASGWLAWSEREDGWFAALSGELVARVQAPGLP